MFVQNKIHNQTFHVMKKTLLSLFAILAFSVGVFAQWGIQNTNLAISRGINHLQAVNATTLWAAAYDGTDPAAACADFTKTTDGGVTWVPGTITNSTGLSLAMIYGVDGNKAWAPLYRVSGTKPQGIYHTSDGGATWAQQTTALFTNAASFPNCVHFWNENEGWCMGDPISGEFEMYTTTNGGTTWVVVPGANIPAPVSGEFGVVGYYSVVGDIVWFGTNKGRIYKSIDKGVNWTVSAVTPLGAIYIQPFFRTADNGFAQDKGASTTGTLAGTTDGGTTWAIVGSTGNIFSNDMAFVPGSEMTWVTTGADIDNSRAGVTFSFDDGLTWTDMSSTIGTQFLATDWVNDSTGWAGAFVDQDNTGGMYIFEGMLAPPVSAFEASDTAIMLGGQVTFTNMSSGATLYQWTFEGGTPGSSTLKNPPPITYNTPGDFNVTLTVSGEYGSNTLVMTDYIYVGGVGINDISAATVTIFPNPVQDVLQINGTSNIQEVQIISLVGQVIMNQQVNAPSATINTAQLNAGVYNLRVKMNDGFINKKIVVK